jgi:hypothetical protein
MQRHAGGNGGIGEERLFVQEQDEAGPLAELGRGRALVGQHGGPLEELQREGRPVAGCRAGHEENLLSGGTLRIIRSSHSLPVQ